MEKNIIKIQAVKKQNDIKKRVCAYARVSTNSNEQQNSFESQVRYYEKYISENKKWEYIGTYSDKGISGTNIKKRTGFNKMIADCNLGKIDIIITKSVTRFARNTIDSIDTIRKLKELDVTVYFERENIYTNDTKSEQMLTILSSIAQMESENISQNIRWSVQKQFKEGTYKVRIAPYGYKKNKQGNLIIDRKNANIIKKIFSQYIGGSGCREIIKYLNEKNILSPSGNIWNTANIMYIIKNQIYTGDLILQKSYKEDIFSPSRLINNGEKPKYLIENNHFAIIDKETFEQANKIYLERREKKIQNNPNNSIKKYEFSGLVYCDECKGKMHRKSRKEDKSTFSCLKRLGDVNSCKNRPIRESFVKFEFINMYNYLYKNRKKLLYDYIKKLEKDDNKRNDDIIDNIQLKIEDIDEQMHTFVKDKANGIMKSAIFIQKYREGQVRKDTLKNEIERIKVSNKFYNEIIETRNIIKIIEKHNKLNEYDKNIFEQVISKIYIKSDRKIIFELKNNITIINEKERG